jgi:cytochrome c-type biogenesis protein CcmE
MARNHRRMWIGMGLLAIVGAVGLLIAGGLKENVVFFLTPSELQAKGSSIHDRPVRLGGQVVPDSKTWDPETRDLRFVVTDGTVQIPVHSIGAPPAMFEEGIGVVVEGRLGADGVFESDNVMVKHSNEYSPPHDDKTPAKMYESLIEGES